MRGPPAGLKLGPKQAGQAGFAALVTTTVFVTAGFFERSN